MRFVRSITRRFRGPEARHDRTFVTQSKSEDQPMRGDRQLLQIHATAGATARESTIPSSKGRRRLPCRTTICIRFSHVQALLRHTARRMICVLLYKNTSCWEISQHARPIVQIWQYSTTAEGLSTLQSFVVRLSEEL